MLRKIWKNICESGSWGKWSRWEKFSKMGASPMIQNFTSFKESQKSANMLMSSLVDI